MLEPIESQIPDPTSPKLQDLLRGSWDLVSRVMSKVTVVISTYNLN